MKKTFCIIYIIFNLSSCYSDKKSEEFDQYLKSNFGMSIPSQRTTFLVIPNNECFNCIKSKIKNANTDSFSKCVIIVTSLPKEMFKDFTNVKFDSTNNMQNLSLIDFSNTEITTKEGKIEKITNNVVPFN